MYEKNKKNGFVTLGVSEIHPQATFKIGKLNRIYKLGYQCWDCGHGRSYVRVGLVHDTTFVEVNVVHERRTLETDFMNPEFWSGGVHVFSDEEVVNIATKLQRLLETPTVYRPWSPPLPGFVNVFRHQPSTMLEVYNEFLVGEEYPQPTTMEEIIAEIQMPSGRVEDLSPYTDEDLLEADLHRHAGCSPWRESILKNAEVLIQSVDRTRFPDLRELPTYMNYQIPFHIFARRFPQEAAVILEKEREKLRREIEQAVSQLREVMNQPEGILLAVARAYLPQKGVMGTPTGCLTRDEVDAMGVPYKVVNNFRSRKQDLDTAMSLVGVPPEFYDEEE
jgi:hypothetical protein